MSAAENRDCEEKSSGEHQAGGFAGVPGMRGTEVNPSRHGLAPYDGVHGDLEREGSEESDGRGNEAEESDSGQVGPARARESRDAGIEAAIRFWRLGIHFDRGEELANRSRIGANVVTANQSELLRNPTMALVPRWTG